MANGRVTSVSFVSADFGEAQEAYDQLTSVYANVPLEEADVIVALGGDGFMLRTIHTHMELGKPIYGMNRGSVGFLMNRFDDQDLLRRLERAKPYRLDPLRMTARCIDGSIHEAVAINEVSVFRQTAQAVHIRVSIDGRERLHELVCDGVLVATPAGSTAHNMSAYGPILPLGSKLHALTAISAYRPRRWRGALLPHVSTVVLDILKHDRRSASATADYTEVRDVVQVTARRDLTMAPTLLFDPEHSLEERIISEQFVI